MRKYLLLLVVFPIIPADMYMLDLPERELKHHLITYEEKILDDRLKYMEYRVLHERRRYYLFDHRVIAVKSIRSIEENTRLRNIAFLYLDEKDTYTIMCGKPIEDSQYDSVDEIARKLRRDEILLYDEWDCGTYSVTLRLHACGLSKSMVDFVVVYTLKGIPYYEQIVLTHDWEDD